jgi:hypothetical protein
MNDQGTSSSGAEVDPSEPIDPGEPISELAHLLETPRPEFLSRIRGSILRRIFTAQTVDFSVMAVFQTFWEYLALALSALGATGKGKGETR